MELWANRGGSNGSIVLAAEPGPPTVCAQTAAGARHTDSYQRRVKDPEASSKPPLPVLTLSDKNIQRQERAKPLSYSSAKMY